MKVFQIDTWLNIDVELLFFLRKSTGFEYYIVNIYYWCRSFCICVCVSVLNHFVCNLLCRLLDSDSDHTASVKQHIYVYIYIYSTNTQDRAFNLIFILFYSLLAEINKINYLVYKLGATHIFTTHIIPCVYLCSYNS